MRLCSFVLSVVAAEPDLTQKRPQGLFAVPAANVGQMLREWLVWPHTPELSEQLQGWVCPAKSTPEEGMEPGVLPTLRLADSDNYEYLVKQTITTARPNGPLLLKAAQALLCLPRVSSFCSGRYLSLDQATIWQPTGLPGNRGRIIRTERCTERLQPASPFRTPAQTRGVGQPTRRECTRAG